MMNADDGLRIGCAGWNIPAAVKQAFGDGPSHLVRYANRFTAVEINSSFYRPHRPTTYARWAESTPPKFRFSVKVPKAITHELRLQDADGPLTEFLAGPAALGEKLTVYLVQLPPSFRFEADIAEAFFETFRTKTSTAIACEPRHASWFAPAADELLRRHRIARVAADPACVQLAGEPGGAPGFIYIRLHGSPRVYYSSYDEVYLARLAARIRDDRQVGREVWCIFDNTADGAAYANAFELSARLTKPAAFPRLAERADDLDY